MNLLIEWIAAGLPFLVLFCCLIALVGPELSLWWEHRRSRARRKKYFGR